MGPEEFVRYFPVDERVDGAEILKLPRDFLGNGTHEGHIPLHEGAFPRWLEIVNLRRLGLPIAVDTSDSLFESGWVERNIEIDKPVAVCLKIYSLACGIGGEQYSNGFLFRIGIELGTNEFTLFRRRLSVDNHETLIIRIAL